MSRISLWAATFFYLASMSPCSAEQKIVTIGTGAVSGVYYPAGGAICRLLNRSGREHNIHCFAESTGGSVNNIQGLRNGDINFAIAQSDWQYEAYRGEGLFRDDAPFTELRSVFSLHSEMFTIAVGKDSRIKNLADLKGKRVNLGDAGSGMRDMMSGLAEIFHWKANYFKETVADKPAIALCSGKIDAMVVAIGHPNGLVQDVTSKCGAKLIPIEGREVDALLAKNPYYAHTTIPGGMYQGNPQPISTFGVKASLITTAAMDEETVYQLTKAVFENFDSFKTLHFVFSTLDRDKMITSGLIAPLHPGAARYYREVGLLKE